MKHLPRLVLYPLDSAISSIELHTMRNHLLTLGLMGTESQHDAGYYLPGPGFMSLLTFLGCSPAAAMTEDSKPSPNPYYIEAVDCSDTVIAICGLPERAPRCPQCKQEVAHWSEATPVARVDLACAQCGFHSPLSGWHWRHQAAFGRYWINIWGVYEGEVLPGDKLLASLQSWSGATWSYAWCKS